MVIWLLILIVLILLLGAGVVKGWLVNIVGAALGFILLAALTTAITSAFDEDGFLYVLGGLLVLSAAAKLYVEATEYRSDPPRSAPTRAPEPPSPDQPVKKVWLEYANDIQHHFDITSQVKAHDIYKTGDAEALESFCADTILRISPERGKGHREAK